MRTGRRTANATPARKPRVPPSPLVRVGSSWFECCRCSRTPPRIRDTSIWQDWWLDGFVAPENTQPLVSNLQPPIPSPSHHHSSLSQLAYKPNHVLSHLPSFLPSFHCMQVQASHSIANGQFYRSHSLSSPNLTLSHLTQTNLPRHLCLHLSPLLLCTLHLTSYPHLHPSLPPPPPLPPHYHPPPPPRRAAPRRRRAPRAGSPRGRRGRGRRG